jgi:hypothetical protein
MGRDADLLMSVVPERWLYRRDGGDRWPVQPGEVWGVGRHRMVCGDLAGVAGERLLALVERPCRVYVDPPWNLGNINSFRTKAGVPHTREPFVVFLEAFARYLARIEPVIAFVEMGRQNQPQLHRYLQDAGLSVIDCWQTTYYHRHPATLTACSPLPAIVPALADLTGMDDDDTPLECLSMMEGGMVVDPCAGRGLTAVVADGLGLPFLGLELSPARTSATLTRLSRLTSFEPERIG